LIRKAGSRFEGILQSNAAKKGNVMDMKMYALVRE